jgi:hypothetical protein
MREGGWSPLGGSGPSTYPNLTVETFAVASDLSAEELRVVRDYAERNKNHETILEQLDLRI